MEEEHIKEVTWQARLGRRVQLTELLILIHSGASIRTVPFTLYHHLILKRNRSKTRKALISSNCANKWKIDITKVINVRTFLPDKTTLNPSLTIPFCFFPRISLPHGENSFKWWTKKNLWQVLIDLWMSSWVGFTHGEIGPVPKEIANT